MKALQSYRDDGVADHDRLMMSTLSRPHVTQFEEMAKAEMTASNVYSIPHYGGVVVELSRVTGVELCTAQLLALDTTDAPENNMARNETPHSGSAYNLLLSVQSRNDIAL